MALEGRVLALKISGTPVSMTAEATTTSDDTVYQITDTDKQVIDKNSDLTVLDGGVETVESYTVNTLTGEITFGSADGGRVITVTGYYIPLSTIAEAHDFTMNESANIIEVPKFGDVYVDKIAGQKSGSGSLIDYDVVDNIFVTELGSDMVLEWVSYVGGPVNRAWILTSSAEMAASIGSAQDMSISFESSDIINKG